ncbi:hypothetical protein [Rhizobium viscosum]|uniref:Lipoprotein n=1 Tax=Rhizobium viscosum TaxID=1673 RepID=A0ABR9IIS6_RHIVS|nr:hypothetical protein [Rhizobium viscosum]MBE1503084.1 hypothetical protein [Rhizobium viscosum]
MSASIRLWCSLARGVVILLGCGMSLTSCEASADEKGVDTSRYPPSGVFANWSKAQMDEIFQSNPEQFAAGSRRLVEAGLPELKLQDTDACYSTFNISDGDGTNIVYDVDKKTFESSSGADIRYAEAWRGKCEYDAGKRLETCTSTGTSAETSVTWYPTTTSTTASCSTQWPNIRISSTARPTRSHKSRATCPATVKRRSSIPGYRPESWIELRIPAIWLPFSGQQSPIRCTYRNS